MYRNRLIASLFSLLFAFSFTSFAQTGGTVLMPLADVKVGAKGTAKTVFQGSKSEEFGVEILGVMRDAVGPRQDLIIGKLSGSNAMRTQVFAGMSGSPVYIDGKLVGAISYSFPWSKEPICGITPIEQMISIFADERKVVASASRPFAVSAASLTAENWSLELPFDLRGSTTIAASSNSLLSQMSGQRLMPISLPVTFSGVSQQTLDRFSNLFSSAGIVAMASVGSGGSRDLAPLKKADETTLLGGDSVVMQLARGDISIAAAGTVTHRDGNKIYAFGHPFFSLGSTNVPMNESHVIIVVPSTNNSFKMAVADAMVGSLRQDRATGVYGILGESPKMLPVQMNLTTSRGRKESAKFESAIDEFLTPLVISIGGQNTMVGHERSIGDTTVDIAATIKIKGHDSVRIERRYGGPQGVALAATSVAAPIQTLLKANFPGLEFENLEANFIVSEGSRSAVIERIAIDRAQVQAGGTANVTIYYRTDSGELLSRNEVISIPKDTPTGALTITISDGAKSQETAATQQFVAKNAAELIAILNAAKRPDRLYVTLSRTSAGVISGASEMTDLPPSMLATINNDRSTGGPKELKSRVVAEQLLNSSDHLTTGTQAITIEVTR